MSAVGRGGAAGSGGTAPRLGSGLVVLCLFKGHALPGPACAECPAAAETVAAPRLGGVSVASWQPAVASLLLDDL